MATADVLQRSLKFYDFSYARWVAGSDGLNADRHRGQIDIACRDTWREPRMERRPRHPGVGVPPSGGLQTAGAIEQSDARPAAAGTPTLRQFLRSAGLWQRAGELYAALLEFAFRRLVGYLTIAGRETFAG